MAQSDRPLIGSVFERKTSPFSSANLPTLSGSSRTGFPTVQHRSKSAFARGRDDLKRNGSTGSTRTKDIPAVLPVKNGGRFVKPPPKPVVGPNDLHRQISEENEKKLAGMTEEERDRARREIIEEFGVGIGDLLRKAQEARERRLAREEAKEVDKAEIIQKMDADAHSEPEKSDTSSDGIYFYVFG